jgi:hypothetical protein
MAAPWARQRSAAATSLQYCEARRKLSIA